MKTDIGCVLWWEPYIGVARGTVVARCERTTYQKEKIVLQSGNDFYVVEPESSKVFDSEAKALLASANRKQQEASRLLTEAAGLFQRAGVAIEKDEQPDLGNDE